LIRLDIQPLARVEAEIAARPAPPDGEIPRIDH
jgi:hypothetical protein